MAKSVTESDNHHCRVIEREIIAIHSDWMKAGHVVSCLKRQSRLQQFRCFSEKIRLEISSESSTQRIHMKNQALFSSKDKSKKLKCRLLQLLFG